MFELCNGHVVSQNLQIVSSYPNLTAISIHSISFIVIIYVIISSNIIISHDFFYIIKSCQIIENNLISQQKNNCNGDRQLQSSNLQNKATSTPYKPQPIKFCRQTHSHYKFQTVKIWNFFGLQNWNWLKIRRVWLCKDGYRLLFFYTFSHQAQKHPSTKLGFIYVEKKS